MATIEIDLQDFEDDIKFHYCNNNNCLLNLTPKSFYKKFYEYIHKLDYDFYIRQDKDIQIEKIIQDLKYLAAEMRL